MHRFVPLLIASSFAFAEVAQGDRPGDDLEAARVAARRGTSLYDLGKYSEALDSFETAYQRKAVPALLFNIAQCHRQLGHLEQAARVYKSYLRTDPPEASARQTRELLARVEDALSREHSAVVSPPHELTDSSAKITTSMPPAPSAVFRPEPPRDPPARQRWPVYTAVGVAAGASALGVMWALGSHSSTNELSRLHQSGPVDPARDASLRSDASSQATRSKISYAVAAAAAAAGVALWFAF
jgi:tetratricopeptide (TPR) repeat protein